MNKSISLSILLASTLFGAGYQIPNNSINSVALSTANIANAHGADSAYYNPANMLNNSTKQEMEASVNYVVLEPISYDSTDNNYHIKSEKIQTFIPAIHYVSGKLKNKNVRIGFSIVTPAGLTRKWDDMPAVATAKKYSLKTLELNPSLGIKVNRKLSLAVGFRYVRASGDIELDGSTLPLNPPASIPYTLNMSGEADAFGYNLALAYKPMQALNISATYRSKILLNLKGNANTILGGNPISSDVSLLAPIPANFILATAYSFKSDTTVELSYDRTMWSAVTETNFNFDNASLEATLGKSTPKKWHDTTAYRIGLTQKLGSLTAMAGFASSTNAADDAYVSFSSPESNSRSYSLGARYAFSDSFDMGIAGLLARNEARTIAQTSPIGVNGTLSERDIYVLTFGAGYKF